MVNAVRPQRQLANIANRQRVGGAQRPQAASAKFVVSASTAQAVGHISGSVGDKSTHLSPSLSQSTEHPGPDIVWQGSYLWKIPFSSDKSPRVRWCQAVHDVGAQGRCIYFKWHDEKNR